SVTSHGCALLPALPLARMRPSRENATDVTAPPEPSRGCPSSWGVVRGAGVGAAEVTCGAGEVGASVTLGFPPGAALMASTVPTAATTSAAAAVMKVRRGFNQPLPAEHPAA